MQEMSLEQIIIGQTYVLNSKLRICNSYIHKKDPTLSHSASISGYHEYFLWLVLHNYMAYLDHSHGYEEIDILNDDVDFNNVVKNIGM